jgi:hypothetical protein
VPVAGAEVVGVHAEVVGQLQPRHVPVAGEFMKTLTASSRIGMRPTSSKPRVYRKPPSDRCR